MRTLFLLAIVVGFGGTLAAAHYMPWLNHHRLPSQTSVVANGGRAEPFVIRLPADRIAATDGKAGGLRSVSAEGVMALPAKFVAEPLLVEHYKVRDATGQVIGVAARHWVNGNRGPTTTWSLMIPARGSLLLRAPGEKAGALDSALQRAGYTPGTAWEGSVEAPLASGGVVAGGSGEFSGLDGSYTETWKLTGVDAAGSMRGTIELYTVTRTP
ncbi:MAG TPA: hypothetical protein VHH11_13185 [Gammaproteobacteria bacterium]|jgi:hypothetical protein|nr:hypothetical protein [Gammaproteobacteria bacterium]